MSEKEEFKILTPREHVRFRIGMYMGSASNEIVERFLLGKWNKVNYVPALSKMIDEILDNSIDEAIRTNFQFANKIDISIQENSVCVTDNGRGIPQEEVIDSSGEKILRPVAAWTRVNAGTSFNDDRITIGTNGLGSSATNFLSMHFVGKTWQNGNLVSVICSDGGLNIKVEKSKAPGSGTSVTFTPDFSLFECKNLSELDTIALIEDRLTSLQLAFPEITFSFNKKKIPISDLKRYAELFVEKDASYIYERDENISFFFCSSEDGFRSNSFVNGVNTRQGGTYVDHVVNFTVDELALMIKKKHKIEVSRSTIKNGLTFVLFARNFVNPKFDSQTKERLTNPWSNVKEHYEKCDVREFKHIAKRIFDASDILDPIIAAQLAKRLADESRSAAIAQKKLKKVKVAKHIAASSPNATLVLIEGDCLEENTMIETLHGQKKIKDVTTNDLVFTHKHRYKKILSKSFSLKEGIKINGNIYSKNHRLFVYDVESKEFEIKEVQNINPNKHKLVRNRIIHNGIENTVHTVQNIKKGGVLITNTLKMVFSDDHEILFLTKNLEIITKKFKDIVVGDVIFL